MRATGNSAVARLKSIDTSPATFTTLRRVSPSRSSNPIDAPGTCCAALSAIASNTAWASPGAVPMIRRMSDTACSRSSAAPRSLNKRALAMAIAAWSANDWSTGPNLGSNGSTRSRLRLRLPSHSSSCISATVAKLVWRTSLPTWLNDIPTGSFRVLTKAPKSSTKTGERRSLALRFTPASATWTVLPRTEM